MFLTEIFLTGVSGRLIVEEKDIPDWRINKEEDGIIVDPCLICSDSGACNDCRMPNRHIRVDSVDSVV